MSKSQFRQELLVLNQQKFKKKEFFCRVWFSRWSQLFKYIFIGKKIQVERNSFRAV